LDSYKQVIFFKIFKIFFIFFIIQKDTATVEISKLAWITFYNTSNIIFIPQNYSILSTFGCLNTDPSCSKTLKIIIQAKNTESPIDTGVNATFNLIVYSGTLPNQ
jgi:hypothetical protein